MIKKTKFITNSAFTLIELLVVMGVIAILTGISIFALQGSREAGRDARRKSDLETIRSGIELFRADCNVYPSNLVAVGSSLQGTVALGCSPANTNIYIQSVPGDPSSGSGYCYNQTSSTTDELCATLENVPTSPSACASCDSGSGNGNYRVISP